MNGTIEQLKSEALSELKQETAGEVSQVETKLTGEVIAEIISFDNLQAKLRAGNVEAINLKIAELLKESKHDEIASLIANQRNETIQLANNLPRYILLTENGTNYLVEAPQVTIKTKGSSNQPSNKAKYPEPFAIGDKIQLKSKDTIDSVIYTVTSQGLEHEGKFYNNKSDITISGLVERFHVGTLGNKASATGMAGISHSYWTKVQ